jgi:hypothetical protein
VWQNAPAEMTLPRLQDLQHHPPPQIPISLQAPAESIGSEPMQNDLAYFFSVFSFLKSCNIMILCVKIINITKYYQTLSNIIQFQIYNVLYTHNFWAN